MSASAPLVSLESTVRQVGAALGVPTCQALTHTHDTLDTWENLFPTSTDAGLLRAGGGDGARGQACVGGGGTPAGRTRGGPGPCPPPPPATSPRRPFPSSRCPLLPPPDTPLLPWPTLWVFSRGGCLQLQPLPARRPLRERWRGLPVCLPRGLLRLSLRDRWGSPLPAPCTPIHPLHVQLQAVPPPEGPSSRPPQGPGAPRSSWREPLTREPVWAPRGPGRGQGLPWPWPAAAPTPPPATPAPCLPAAHLPRAGGLICAV